MNKLKILTFIGLINLLIGELSSQDLHFSQFYYNHQSANPALVSNYYGDKRFGVNYRHQWLSVPVPYLSISMIYDTKFNLKSKKDQIGLGFGLDYDQAGDSKLSVAKIIGEVAYTRILNRNNSLSFGLNIGGAQRRLSNELLRWDVQWNGDRYDANIGSKETYKQTGSFFADLGVGAAYHYYYSQRTKLTLSGAVFHLNKPDQNFYGASSIKAKLPMRNVYGASAQVGVGKVMDLILGGQFQQQEDYKEQVYSGRLRFYMNQKPGSLLNALIGCNVRIGDALIPNLGFEYNNWLVSGSYDLNTSQFKTATNQRGGPELTVQYIFRSVKPSSIYKKCPIY